MNSPSWRNGEALSLILQTPFARTHFLNLGIVAFPPVLLKCLSWFVVAAELLFGPLVLWKQTRAIAWLTMTGIHVGILVTIDFPDLTLGMLIAHGFVFHPGWLQYLRERFPPKMKFLSRLSNEPI
jgi:hypothetical protein